MRRSRSSLSTKFFGRCKRAQACKFKGNQIGLLDPLPCVSFLVAECLGYLKNLRFLVLFITKVSEKPWRAPQKRRKNVESNEGCICFHLFRPRDPKLFLARWTTANAKAHPTSRTPFSPVFFTARSSLFESLFRRSQFSEVDNRCAAG